MNKPTLDPARCKKTVYGGFSGSFNQCSRKPVKDGYCKQHHPDAAKARSEAWNAKFEADRRYSEWWRRKAVIRDAIAGAAIAGVPFDDLLKSYRQHLLQEPPKPM